MRVLLDTNVVVSALLFGGVPRALLRLLCERPIELWTSRPLLRELADTLTHPKLRSAVGRTGLSVEALAQAYVGQCLVVPDTTLEETAFAPDPSDAVVIAAAIASRAHWIITGDKHLLEWKGPVPCEVLSVREALERVASVEG